MFSPTSRGTMVLGQAELAKPAFLFDTIESGLQRARPHSVSRTGTSIELNRWPSLWFRGSRTWMGGISRLKVSLAGTALRYELEHEGAVAAGFLGACAGTLLALALGLGGRASLLGAVGIALGVTVGLASLTYVLDVLNFRNFLAACVARARGVPA